LSAKYETAVPLGQGASGEVLRAWDPRLGRAVAVKMLRSDDPEMVARMQREARLQAKVRHPNVAEVYDVGTWDGRPYIAMRLVEGEPLDRAAAGLPLERRVRLLATVSRAVHAAHSVGLIHRDLKPGNILVETGDDGALEPFVVDFGIAREAAVAGETVTGQMIGTPGYMSPEQARGETTRLDRRSDVFSLGAVLYQVLTGRPPFEGDSAVDSLVRVLGSDPVPPRRLVPGLPRDLSTVVLRCLEKDPDRRYGSARELAEDLDAFLDGRPIAARPPGLLRRLARPVRRHPVVAAASLIALLALGGLGAATLRARHTARARALAAQRFGERVERMDGWMRYAHLAPLHDLRPERRRVREEIAAIEEEMARLGAPPRPAGLYALGSGWLALGDAERAAALLGDAWDGGHRSAGAALALGEAHARLYREARERALRISDAAVRNATLERAAALHRRPAERALRAGMSAEGADEPYARALLAFLADDREGIEAAVEGALAGRPWLYEGHLLAGDAALAELRAGFWRADAAKTGEPMEAARAAYAEAARVARSDPRAYLGLCAAEAAAVDLDLNLGHWTGTDGEEALEPARKACGSALAADPESTEARELLSYAHWRLATGVMRTGGSPLALLDEARRQAEAGLAVDPEHPRLLHDLGVAHAYRGQWEQWHGTGDPTADYRKALTALRSATDAAPDDGVIWKALGDAYLRLGWMERDDWRDSVPTFEAAEAAYRRAGDTPSFPAERLTGSRANLASDLAFARLRSGADPTADLDRGEALSAAALDTLTSRAGMLRSLAILHWTRALWDEAERRDPGPAFRRAYRALDEAEELDPDDDYVRVVRAAVQEEEARARAARGEPVAELVAEGLETVASLPETERRDGSLFEAGFAAAAARRALDRERPVGGEPASAWIERAEAAAREHRELGGEVAAGHEPLAEALRLRAEQRAAIGDCVEARRAGREGIEVVARGLELSPRFAPLIAHRAAIRHALAACATEPSEAVRLDGEARADLARALEIYPTLPDPIRDELASG
jgi:eukaryotic-like serine/threonine-protein kinase